MFLHAIRPSGEDEDVLKIKNSKLTEKREDEQKFNDLFPSSPLESNPMQMTILLETGCNDRYQFWLCYL